MKGKMGMAALFLSVFLYFGFQGDRAAAFYTPEPLDPGWGGGGGSGGGETDYCGTEIDPSRPYGNPYEGSPFQEETTTGYSITFTGSQPVYQETLSKSDFRLYKHIEVAEKVRVYQKYYYESINGGTCDEVSDGIYIKTVTKNTETKKERLSSSNLSLTTRGSKGSGTLTYVAAYSVNGNEVARKEVDTYWVKSVDVKLNTSLRDWHMEPGSYFGLFNCTVTYGNGKKFPCDEDNNDASGAKALIENKRTSSLEKNMRAVASQTVDKSQVLIKNQYEKNRPGPYGINPRIQPYYEIAFKNRLKGTLESSSPSDVRGGTGVVYRYPFGDLYVVAYKDKHTGKSDYDYVRVWHLAFVDVEDETRSPNKKEIYDQHHVWSKSYDRTKQIIGNVTCKIYYFGPVDAWDCVPTIKENSIVKIDGKNYAHSSGTYRMANIYSGYHSIGNYYEFIYYTFSYSDGQYNAKDEDYRLIIYAQKTKVNNMVVEIKEKSNGPSEAQVKSTNPVQTVIVKETHKNGKATPKTYSTGTPEPFYWHAYAETYENFVKPSCEVTYAPSKVNPSYIYKRNCSNMMFYEFSSVTNNDLCIIDWEDMTVAPCDDANRGTNPGSDDNMVGAEFTYSYGQPVREARYIYLDNGAMAYQTILFLYPTKIDIKFSDDYTYQDEPYPTTTCTKYYPGAPKYGVNAFTRSCLDMMYITKDTGQNNKMGQPRKITFKYVNNNYSDQATLTRVYANKLTIKAPAKSGKSGFRGYFYATLTWQDGTTKDVSKKRNMWRSYVTNTGETVNYIGESWENGYVDTKGERHKPRDINDFYIPDPISKNYTIEAVYPKTVYNNGLYPGQNYVTDVYAPATGRTTFRLIGIKRIDIIDKTPTVDQVDKDQNGNPLKNKFPELKAAQYSGISGRGPKSGLAFNDKTYQTGHFYDFVAQITWDDGTVEQADRSKYPELTWRYQNAKGQWKYDYSDYPIPGHVKNMPYSGLDHRLLLEGWNPIRFDLFSESSIRKPSGQNNAKSGVTYVVVNAWAHRPIGLVIVGPSVTNKPSQIHEYKSFINWNDGNGLNQNAQPVGANNNPWGKNHGNSTEVTNKLTTKWFKDEVQLPTPASGPLKTTFDDIKGKQMYRTIASSWGDNSRTIPGFQFWDYLYGELDVLITDLPDGPTDNCNSNVPKMNCELPVHNPSNPNYRMPTNESIAAPRIVEHSLKFRVTGISQGSGE